MRSRGTCLRPSSRAVSVQWPSVPAIDLQAIGSRARASGKRAEAFTGALAAALALGAGLLAAPARAEAPRWRLEQPRPPEASSGVPGSQTPIGLGRIGDLEFWAPNRGLLITDGNPKTIPPGVWVYNGQGWRELASQCGATDGRIAWAGANEFWTVSDGRPGQSANGAGLLPPLEDDTLCRFAVPPEESALQIVGSYASPAFKASSYQPMDGAACLETEDCWFTGAPLPAPQLGAFQLHWNGSSLEAEPNTRIDATAGLGVFEGSLYESVALPQEEQAEGEQTPEEILHPTLLEEVAAGREGAAFRPLHPSSSTFRILPEYASESYPQALEPLSLSSDESSLWAAAGPVETPPSGSKPGALTVLRDASGVWSQVLGPEVPASMAVDPPSLSGQDVAAVAGEPGGSDAWLALDSGEDIKRPNPTELAKVAQVSAGASVSEQTLPEEEELKNGVGAKGAAAKIVCPAQNDCWMATTQGWLFHYSEASDRTLPADTDAAFNGPLITYRPPDQGLPQEISDTLPVDDSGLEEFQPESASALAALTKVTVPQNFASVTEPLLSGLHTRIIHGSTLELSFHLAAKARVRLIAKHRSKVVASTSTYTFKAGNRSLQLRLNRRAWPTKLELKTHALAPLPTESTRGSGVETVTTSAAFPNAHGLPNWGASLSSEWGMSLANWGPSR